MAKLHAFVLKWPAHWTMGLLLSTLGLWLLFCEFQTSALQAWVFSRYARQMTYKVEAGPSSTIVFPQDGPFDRRFGYSSIPDFRRLLEAEGFDLSAQSRFSPELTAATRRGIAPPFRESFPKGLGLTSTEGLSLYEATSKEVFFGDYDEIPRLIVETLLFIENRELGESQSDRRTNPALEWDRLAKASLSYAGRQLGLPLRVEGGSTLATQLEKYRHSRQGRTGSAAEKLNQILAASLKVYRSGVDTRVRRREIVLDYLNTVPLSAVPGYGEVHGLGQGLRAWFGTHLRDICRALESEETTPEKVKAFNQVLTLLCAIRAPSYYLVTNRSALEARMRSQLTAMIKAGVVDAEFRVESVSPSALPTLQRRSPRNIVSPNQKTVNSLRLELLDLLRVPGLYELDRLDLKVESTIDEVLHRSVLELFANLSKKEFLAAQGLQTSQTLAAGDPSQVVYSLLLLEATPDGNLVRVQTDNLNAAFDLNHGMKMALGSSAKLRTLAHYLVVVSSLYDDFKRDGRSALSQGDPLSVWVAEMLQETPELSLDLLLDRALARTYSANPQESFFTGGGRHYFHNFDSRQDGHILSVRQATLHSTNLVFIRLMRDLVRFHQAKLGYEPEAIVADPGHPERKALLRRAVEDEARQVLWRAYQRFSHLSPESITDRLLGSRRRSPRHTAMLFFAWQPRPVKAVGTKLLRWFQTRGLVQTPEEVQRWVKAYGNPDLNLADYGYLVGRHPLEIWCAGLLVHDPSISWDELWESSAEPRVVSFTWLFRPRHRRAQALRLRTQMEREAFRRMTLGWQQLGFPFEEMVPSLATAIGDSSDQPAGLAELMGIIVNNGQLLPMVRLKTLTFGQQTPYHTVFEKRSSGGRQVMPMAVARAIQRVLQEVVSQGTGRRLQGAFTRSDGTSIAVGGKTGTGDNRHKSFRPDGALIASRVVNRTATFVFQVGDRYFGVVTACVLGEQAGEFTFTSALPVTLLKLLAPILMSRFSADKSSIHPSLQAALETDELSNACESELTSVTAVTLQ